MAPRTRTIKERFESLVRITPGCWYLSNRKSKYPVMPVDGKNATASRISYELYVGPVPGGRGRDGFLLCHRCDNPRCVNPDHLFIGTHQDNADDMVRKGRSPKARGEEIGNSKLTAEQISAIRADARSQSAIAAEYGVHQSLISLVKSKKRWSHI